MHRSSRSKTSSTPPRTVGIVSLGCAKNLVDSEIMLGVLGRTGWAVTSYPKQADVLIINTCAFIDVAQQESVDTILELTQWREEHRPDQAIIVAGCLTQRYKERLLPLLPEVDLFLGLDEVPEIDRWVEEARKIRNRRLQHRRLLQRTFSSSGLSRRETLPESVLEPPPAIHVHPRSRYIPDASAPRLLLTPPHYAYVKIAEGCNHPCSFCVIPQIRGPYRSRPIEDIVQEVQTLVARGVKEINLISQDCTYYGRDFLRTGSQKGRKSSPDTGEISLARLLEVLDQLEGDFWIRVLYTHPAHWTDDLIEVFARCSKLVPYVDLPLQHIHPLMLERMRRQTSPEQIRELLQKLRQRIPHLTLRTTFIVGFPGETEAMFAELIQFVEEQRFDRVGVFAYSEEEGTLAARMEGQVPPKIRRLRQRELLRRQRRISAERNQRMIGQTIWVLTEGPVEPTVWKRQVQMFRREQPQRDRRRPWIQVDPSSVTVSRSTADAPEVDGRVYLLDKLPPGQFVPVKILGASDYDLVGVLLKSGFPPAESKR